MNSMIKCSNTLQDQTREEGQDLPALSRSRGQLGREASHM